MRYAEILYIYAEAKSWYFGADLMQTINVVRDRVGMPAILLALNLECKLGKTIS